MKIVEFSLRKRVTVTMVVTVLVIFGTISFYELGLDMLPEIESPYISVITTYSGLSSEDIEENVTRPIEQWVSTVSRVKKINSISQEGLSIIMVEFESDTNLDFAAQDVRERIGLFENFLPEGAENPLVIKFNLEDMPIMMYGITAGKKWDNDLGRLKDRMDREVAARLERLDGVASAVLFSSEQTEILVNVDKGRLEARNLSIVNIERAIRASNINLPSGHLNENHREYLLRTTGKLEKVEEIGDIMVGRGKQGQPVFLRDIAHVGPANKEIRNLVRINGGKGLMMMVTKSFGANTVLVARQVKKTLEEIKPTLDPGIHFSIALDFSRIIEIMAVRSAGNILIGGALAMVLIFLFLRNTRPTLAIGIAIPLSLITTFIALRLAGYTLNLVTMSGLALGVGMLVDNAIVVIENTYRHLEEGKTALEAARSGATEVGTAIIASTMTTIAVFFPMLFATGIAGVFSRGLALSVSFSLLSSLFVALTIIPMLAVRLFRVEPGGGGRGQKAGKSLQASSRTDLGYNKFMGLRRYYGRMLRVALTRRKTVMFSVLGLFMLCLVAAPFLGTDFLPETDRAMLFLKLNMPVGTSLAETDRVIRHIEAQSLKNPHVITTMVSVGLSEQNAQDSAAGFNPEGSYQATLWAYLTTISQRDITDRQILEEWRQYFPQLQSGKIRFIDMAATSMGQSSPSPIMFNIYGRELPVLKDIAQRVRTVMAGIPGSRDVEITLDESKPELEMKIKKEEAARLGLTPHDISRQVQTFTIGTVVSRIILGGEEREIRVRLREGDRADVDALRKLPIAVPGGGRVYLSQVVDFRKSVGAVKIHRENQIRRVSVTANVHDRDLGGIVTEILEKTRNITDNLPGGYFYHMGGAYEDMMEAFVTMVLALLLAIVLVYAVMASQFESFKSPLIIMFTIPLALIGVVLLLALTGKTISLPVAMGFIMLSGIVVNNGIVMVDYVNQLIGRGMDAMEAVIEGAAVRLRPILITALSTISGMLPMALATSEGAEIRSPMALTVIGGLMASTLLTLFVVPIMYTYFSKIKTK